MSGGHHKMKRQIEIGVPAGTIILSVAAFMLAPAAYAHVGVGQPAGFMRGFMHPLGGFDHVLAMVAVGLWAAQRGGRALWLIPGTFVTIMTLGGLAATQGFAVPFVEQGIALSVLVLGVLVAIAARWPLPVSMLIVGAFALFHGHSHGTEMPTSVSGMEYGAGFVLATSLLHAIGVAAGSLTRALDRNLLVRLWGSAIAAGGVYLLLAT
jgi:urease accessory protein